MIYTIANHLNPIPDLPPVNPGLMVGKQAVHLMPTNHFGKLQGCRVEKPLSRIVTSQLKPGHSQHPHAALAQRANGSTPQGLIWPDRLKQHHTPVTAQAMIAPINSHSRKHWLEAQRCDAQPTETLVAEHSAEQQLLLASKINDLKNMIHKNANRMEHLLESECPPLSSDMPNWVKKWSNPFAVKFVNEQPEKQQLLHSTVSPLKQPLHRSSPAQERLQRSEARQPKADRQPLTRGLSSPRPGKPAARQPDSRPVLPSTVRTPAPATPASRALPPLARALAQSTVKDTPKDKALDTLLSGLVQFTHDITRQFAERGEGKQKTLIDAQIKAQLSGLSVTQTQRALSSLTGGLAGSVRAIGRFASTQATSDAIDVQPRDCEQLSRLSRAATVAGSLVKELNRKLKISTAGMRASETTADDRSRLSRHEKNALRKILATPPASENQGLSAG